MPWEDTASCQDESLCLVSDFIHLYLLEVKYSVRNTDGQEKDSTPCLFHAHYPAPPAKPQALACQDLKATISVKMELGFPLVPFPYLLSSYKRRNKWVVCSQTLSCFILKSTSLRKTTQMSCPTPARMWGLFTWLHLGVLSVACNGEAAMTPSLWHHWNSGKNISDGKHTWHQLLLKSSE